MVSCWSLQAAVAQPAIWNYQPAVTLFVSWLLRGLRRLSRFDTPEMAQDSPRQVQDSPRQPQDGPGQAQAKPDMARAMFKFFKGFFGFPAFPRERQAPKEHEDSSRRLKIAATAAAAPAMWS